MRSASSIALIVGRLFALTPLQRSISSFGIQRIDTFDYSFGAASALTKSANDIDRHVGSRLRMRRLLIGMTQEKLGEALGVTFQQVQKYEKGTNRIGASRLQRIAQVLNVAPAFFFDEMPGQPFALENGFAEGDSVAIVAFLSTAEGMTLNKAFVRIKDLKVRRKLIDLVTVMADLAPETPPDEEALPSQK